MQHEVVNHKVFGKVLGRAGKVHLMGYDDAMKAADKHNGTLNKAMNGKYYVKVSERVEEDAPANNAGDGNIAGIQGDPPVRTKVRVSYKKRNQQGVQDMEDGLALMRRKTPMMEEEIRGSVSIGSFAGNQTFVVPSKKFNEMRMHKAKGKHWKSYIGEDEHGIAIREYANKKPKAPIILQDENTGAMCYARYGGKSK